MRGLLLELYKDAVATNEGYALFSGHGFERGRCVGPRQELIDLALGMAGDDAGHDVAEISLRVDGVELDTRKNLVILASAAAVCGSGVKTGLAGLDRGPSAVDFGHFRGFRADLSPGVGALMEDQPVEVGKSA